MGVISAKKILKQMMQSRRTQWRTRKDLIAISLLLIASFLA